MYISEIITVEDIEKWHGMCKILIKAPCGTGKTRFVLDVLYAYARERGWKILYLCNRKLLREQIESIIQEEGKDDVFTLLNYQKMEYDFNHAPWEETRQLAIAREINENYDMVISDEAHYYFTDSWAGLTSNVMLLAISRFVTIPVIYMTATPQILEQYQPFLEEFIYDVPKIPQIRSAYYFSHDDAIERRIDFILRNTNDKIIYFGRSTKRLLELKRKYGDDCMFVCAETNDNASHMDMEKRDAMIRNSKFEARILLATSALDNGINIKDSQVRHIICEYPDVITTIQCIGRKRFLGGDDFIDIYIKNEPYYQGLLQESKKKFRRMHDYLTMDVEEFKINYKELLGKEGFALNDSDENIGNLPFLVVDSNYYKTKYDIEFYESIVGHGYTAYIKRLCDEMGLPFNIFRRLEDDLNYLDIISVLDSLEGQRLFKNDQKQLKKFFAEQLYRWKKESRYSGINGINKFLEKIGLDATYKVVSKQYRNSKTKKKETIWEVKKNA